MTLREMLTTCLRLAEEEGLNISVRLLLDGDDEYTFCLGELETISLTKKGPGRSDPPRLILKGKAHVWS